MSRYVLVYYKKIMIEKFILKCTLSLYMLNQHHPLPQFHKFIKQEIKRFLNNIINNCFNLFYLNDSFQVSTSL